MKGYKALHKDMTAYGGFLYELGKTYRMDGEIQPCARGFHFCQRIADCYNYYPRGNDTIICEVEASGEVKTEDDIKFVTNEITIIAIVEESEHKGNSGEQNTGYCNAGNYNTGNCNAGNYNTGDQNTGRYNTGYLNTGDFNTGHHNTGNSNTSCENIGHNNAGRNNIGSWNTGCYNMGCHNTGDHNVGDWNVGDWNVGDTNVGCFCENKNPKIMLFDEPSEWTMLTWLASKANRILSSCPTTRIERSEGINKIVIVTVDDRQKWWDGLGADEKEECLALPNFNADKFCRCIGIKHI